MKRIVIGIVLSVTILGSLLLVIFSGEDNNKLSINDTENMLSYTLDGEKTSVKPTKESGYLANSIKCQNDTNVVWDNTNWEVEVIKAEQTDRCNVDFTKDVSSSGYRISVTTNVNSGIDSLSKATISGGKVIFYPSEGYEITGVSGCSNGKLEDGKVVVSNITSNQTCNITVEEPKKTLYAQLTDGVYYSNVVTNRSGGTVFDSPLGGISIDSSYDTTGVIYKETARKEDGRDVYYFAGNPQDNWVKFAGFYWRIIRTNEDGSVRLLYAGISPDTQEGYIGTSTYSINSSTYNNTMYVGWKYGTSGSLANNRGYSNQGAAKAALDSWYSINITGSNANMVSTDAIYCNDRAGEAYNATGTMYYAAYSRLGRSSNRQPSYKCGEVTGTKYNNSSWVSGTLGSMYSDASNADKFSKTTGAGGNGQLTYPVGLMTADEVAFAGGKYASNAPNTYYYRNSRTGCTGASGDPCSVTGTTWWWTMSPFFFYSSGSVFDVGGSTHSGYLHDTNVHNTYGAVRPVVSLKSSVLVSGGNGTATNPYTVE